MSFEKIKLLMWKNYKLRRVRWFMTLLELLLPIAIIYGFAKLSSAFNDGESTLQNATSSQNYSEQGLLHTVTFDTLYYTPSNSFTDDVVTKVKEKLDESRNMSTFWDLYNITVPTIPNVEDASIRQHFEILQAKINDSLKTLVQGSLGKTVVTTAVANEAELEEHISGINYNSSDYRSSKSFGLVFMDQEQNGTAPLPSHLSYKIRTADTWLTRLLYPDVDIPGPNDNEPYVNQGFAGIQVLVDQVFMEKTGIPKRELEVQGFPYPEYVPPMSIKSVAIGIAGMVIIVTVISVSSSLISDILEEKESGVRELMKLAGVTEAQIWLCWFLHAIIISFLSYTISSVILKIPFNGEGSEVFQHTSFAVLWSIIMLFVVSNIAYCFLLCSIFHKAPLASTFYIAVLAGLYIASVYAPVTKYPILAKFGCLLPVAAFSQGFNQIISFELQGLPFDWSATAMLSDVKVSVVFVFFMLIFDTVLFMLLSFYFSAVNPGKYGSRRSPFFIFKLASGKKGEKGVISKIREDKGQPLRNLDEKVDNECIETPPHNLEATVQIKDLYKNFGNVYAVQGVNLNIYKGEITALLGHNGAGKTTTMSILTGLTSPTAGAIQYKNLDVFRSMGEFRRKLGMCPQEDRLFSYLSVLDHLIFFGMLKGASSSEARKEAMEYLRMMEMESKIDNMGKELSGGMKRKLCLSIALMGKAEVLILDEPTSGMDVQSRRKLWDLLLGLRGADRTIILSTHYMEEADALGDRIAIMNHGTIVCHGTGMFLKKVYGAGYYLTITRTRQDSTQLTNLIQNYVTGSALKSESTTEVVYKLPLCETNTFPALFKTLESQQESLGIRGIGMNCTTMEQVFLKVGGLTVYDTEQKSRRNSNTVTDSVYDMSNKRAKGLDLVLQQVSALIKKKWLYTYRTLYGLFGRVLVPTVFCLILLNALNALDKSPENPLNLTLSTYPKPEVWEWQTTDSDTKLTNAFADYVKDNGGSLSILHSSNYTEDLLDYGRKHITKFRRELLLGGKFNESFSKILYNKLELHSLPIALNTYSNSFLKQANASISTVNHPILRVSKDEPCPFIESQAVYCAFWVFALALYTIDLTGIFTAFLNRERVDGFKHIQMMSNVSPLVYWLGTLSFDVLFFLTIVCMRMIIYGIFSDHYNFLVFNQNLAVLMFVLVLFAISGLLFTYLFSFTSNSKEGSYSLFLIFNLLCGVVSGAYYMVDMFANMGTFSLDVFTWWLVLYYATKYIILFVAPLNFTLIFIKLVYLWLNNTRCDHCIPSALPACQEQVKTQSFFVYSSYENPNGILMELEFLLIDIILYSVILGLISFGLAERIAMRWKQSLHEGKIKKKNMAYDEDVKLEKDKVQRIKSDPRGTIIRKNRKFSSKSRKAKSSDSEMFETVPLRAFQEDVALLVDGFKKTYNWFTPFTAVEDVSFVVKSGECFGLLGVNGAGKTTSFRMLTAEVLPTEGDSAIDSIKLSVDKSKYLSMAGYCAQTNCFIEELTGREMLALIATLRGMRGSSLSNTVDKWINILGLEEYQNQQCGSYSGGNKRKLCTAMSLIGDPRVVFLDEPTSGVDPVSRRKLYDVMEQSRASGQAVVLTSHSMEECENLCDRLTIMSGGVMRCIGSAQHLKQRFAQGFSVLIKIKDMVDGARLIEEAKYDIMNTFSQKSILKDEHKGLLYYQIKDTSLPWSVLFERMEKLKSKHGIMEDYTLTDTSLEEVFMSFAKES